MASAIPIDLLVGRVVTRGDPTPVPGVRPLGWPELEAILPDGGLPRGVVELSGLLAGGTSIALAAIRAAHEEDARTWCAWVDPERTLHGPGAAQAGAALDRLLIVSPPREELGRIAVKVVASRAFEVVVVDMDPVPQVSAPRPRAPRRRVPPEVLVRKLALAAEQAGTTVVLLTDSRAPRAVPWPVALRLDLSRPSDDGALISVRVAKERRGRIGMKKTLAMRASHPAWGGP
jgi:hypothetical protein